MNCCKQKYDKKTATTILNARKSSGKKWCKEKKMSAGENQLWILDKDGYNVLHSFNDCRLQSITKDLMSFIGYTHVKCEKVSIYVWV